MYGELQGYMDIDKQHDDLIPSIAKFINKLETDKIKKDEISLTERQLKILEKQIKIQENTRRVYLVLVFLTMMSATLLGFQTIINNLDWNYNYLPKHIFFIGNVVLVFIAIFGSIFLFRYIKKD